MVALNKYLLIDVTLEKMTLSLFNKAYVDKGFFLHWRNIYKMSNIA